MAPRPLPCTDLLTQVGEALAFFREGFVVRQAFERYGNVYETRLLGQPLVFVRGGAAIGDLLADPEATEGWWPASVKQLLGSRSLANRNGADHRALRRVVGQLFSAAALRRYSPGIVAQVDALAAELAVAPAPVPLVERLRRFAFTVIAEVVLGLDGADRDALFADFEIWTQGLFALPLAIPGTPFARALQARQRLMARLGRVLERARHQPSGGLDLLAGGRDAAGQPLSDDDLAEQLLLLLFAGYETTASSLSCLLAALLQHDDVRAWLEEELGGLPWPPPPGKAAVAFDGAAAPRLAAVVQEVMRLNPPVGGFFRRTRRDLVLDGVLVPAGRVVQVALLASNRYPPDADADADADAGGSAEDLERFRPERHLGEGCGLTLLPFGGGERVCLGRALAELEIRLMAVGLLQQVRLQLAPDQDLSLALVPSPSPRGGLRVRGTALGVG